MLIFLIGYMGCGKSTIGRKLQKKLGWELVDTDKQIESDEGCTIAELFESKGEDYFRRAERMMVLELALKSEDYIVSTGGGLPIWGDNMELLNRIGQTIYLYRSAQNIASRLSPHGRYKRPKLRGLNDEELVAYMSENLELRHPVYSQAKLTIDAASMEDKKIVKRILKYIDGQ